MSRNPFNLLTTWTTPFRKFDGQPFSHFTAPNYASPSDPPYTFYWHKHNGLAVFDAISQNPARAKRLRTFNDFANDAVNGTIPQWIFVTPNIVNDARRHHDRLCRVLPGVLARAPPHRSPCQRGGYTHSADVRRERGGHGAEPNIHLATGRSYLVVLPHIDASQVAQHRLTFEERLTTRCTCTSSISTVEANWDLKSLGRQDTNRTVSNMFSFVAAKTGYKNLNVPADKAPMFNLSGVAPGPLTSGLFVPFSAPNLDAHGAGSSGVLTNPGLNKS